jgi:hypothetical protein
MSKFRKATLKVGRYHSPDGVVDVTPERLQHWADQFRSMSDAGQVIPIGWDHADNEADLQPISMSAYRSAENTIGQLNDLRLAEDGQSLEATLDVRTPKAEEAAELNTVYISPVIFDTWRDGHGNQYDDVITHVDFVNHPVDHSQGPFVPVEPGCIACAIRMGLSTTPYTRMTTTEATMADDTTSTGDNDGGGDEVLVDTGTKLKDVMESLAKMDIVLSDDTSEENFLEHLHQALLTAAAHLGKDDEAGDGGVELAPDDAAYATMSLQARGAFKFAERSYRDQIKRRLSDLLASGRCTPAEHKQHAERLPAIKLSVTASGEPKPIGMEQWIESREAIPEGACWDAKTRTRMSTSVAPPDAYTTEPTEQEEDEIVNQVFRSRVHK